MTNYQHIIKAAYTDSECESALADLLYQCEQSADNHIHRALKELQELSKHYRL